MESNIFKKRETYKPFEYPEVIQFTDRINQTFWTHSEVNFTADEQNFHVDLKDFEREAIVRSLLGIAQTEVSVKTFWGDLYKTFPKPEFNVLGSTFAHNECFDDKTEILTNKGFKLFKNLQDNDLVASYNLETQNITFEKPIRKMVYPYKGKMHHYEGKTMDLMITPNHEIIVQNPHTYKVKKVQSQSGIWSRNYICPVAGKKEGNKEFTNLDKLLIALQADGTLYGNTPSGKQLKRLDFSINLYKQNKIDRFRSILEALNIKYIETQKENNTIFNASLRNFVDFDIISKIKSFGYINIENIDTNWGLQFLEELSYWDCSNKIDTNYFTYYNTNEEAIDKVSIVATLSNCRTCKSINRIEKDSLNVILPQGEFPQSSKTCYALTICYTNTSLYPLRKEVDYDGYIYCVEVPNNNIVVRRGKRTCITGNSIHSEAYSKLLEVLGLEERFNNILDIPIFKKKNDFIKGFLNSISENYYRKLIFFTLIIENASLFSQFATILSFTRFLGYMKNTSNIIAWTSADEDCHKDFPMCKSW